MASYRCIRNVLEKKLTPDSPNLNPQTTPCPSCLRDSHVGLLSWMDQFPVGAFILGARPSITSSLKSQNHLGWKRPLRSSSPTINLTLPSPPLNHVLTGLGILCSPKKEADRYGPHSGRCAPWGSPGPLCTTWPGTRAKQGTALLPASWPHLPGLGGHGSYVAPTDPSTGG